MNENDLQDFLPPWLEQYLGKMDAQQRAQFLLQYGDAVQQMLSKLEDLPFNQVQDGSERGTFNVRIPGSDNKFVNLKELIMATAKYGGPLLLASAFAAPLLALVGIKVAAAHLTLSTGSSAGFALFEAFSRLNEDEMEVYQAVAAAIERNKNKVLGNQGASIKDVEESYRLDPKLLPQGDLPGMLKQLEKKKVIKGEMVGGILQYFLSF